MRETFDIPKKAAILAWLLTGVGVLALIFGFITDPPATWTSILLNNFFFLSLALGAMFFYSVQYVTDAGWSVMFKRVPEAMSSYVFPALVVMLVLYFGAEEIYEWAVPSITESDALIAHKSPYLNLPFFYLRLVILFAVWIAMIIILRRASAKEDTEGGAEWFRRSRHWSMVFIFIFAITFSIAAFDWIMSIDSHWFSALFGIRAIISSFYYAVATVILIVICLNRSGYFESMNKYHLSDFARYLFRLSIVWGYLWFMQYLIIWYANIPETTFYYVYRVSEPWTVMFYAELIINWTIPFLALMADYPARKRAVLVPVSILLLAGFYISLYLQIMPGSRGVFNPGFIDIGSFAGFAGVFILLFMRTLSKRALFPKQHALLKESLGHHL